MTLLRASLPIICLMFMLAGCATDTSAPQGGGVIVAKDIQRDTEAAKKHNEQAAKCLDSGNLDKAESELRAALVADHFYGPAHNNLGTLYFRRKNLYGAANEYQTAAQLMPTRAEPRINLGLVFETATRLNDAVKPYEEALALDPNNMIAAGNLARVYTRLDTKPDRTRDLLKQIILKDCRPKWVEWAKERLSIMGTTQPAQ